MRALLLNTRAHSTDAHARMPVEEGQSSKKPGEAYLSQEVIRFGSQCQARESTS